MQTKCAKKNSSVIRIIGAFRCCWLVTTKRWLKRFCATPWFLFIYWPPLTTGIKVVIIQSRIKMISCVTPAIINLQFVFKSTESDKLIIMKLIYRLKRYWLEKRCGFVNHYFFSLLRIYSRKIGLSTSQMVVQC